jgi:hypothetical protein
MRRRRGRYNRFEFGFNGRWRRRDRLGNNRFRLGKFLRLRRRRRKF